VLAVMKTITPTEAQPRALSAIDGAHGDRWRTFALSTGAAATTPPLLTMPAANSLTPS